MTQNLEQTAQKRGEKWATDIKIFFSSKLLQQKIFLPFSSPRRKDTTPNILRNHSNDQKNLKSDQKNTLTPNMLRNLNSDQKDLCMRLTKI